LTSGGDCPGLNAVIRAVTKTLEPEGVQIFGFVEGFTGLVENRFMILDDKTTSGLLTVGGTILRTSRNKPHKMPTPDGGYRDMTGAAVETYRRLNLDCLICLGGGGTQKNANRLKQQGLNVVTVPKTIDNDVWGTDTCFGFDSGMAIACEAMDRLHTTASSHHRVMLVDIMGHNSGWLALGAGIATGADVILIPEIPYDIDVLAKSLLARMRRGKMFSIVAVAEGAISTENAAKRDALLEEIKKLKEEGAEKGMKLEKEERSRRKKEAKEHHKEPVSVQLGEYLEEITGLETRVVTLGHLQRGGVPTPTDRLLSTKFGTMAADCVLRGEYGVMVAKRGQEFVPVPLEEVVGNKRLVTLDHPWIQAARDVGTCLGDEMPHGYQEEHGKPMKRARE
jgi:6-phosphofructokinase 1